MSRTYKVLNTLVTFSEKADKLREDTTKEVALHIAKAQDLLVAAFIAEFKCKPSEAELCTRHGPEGISIFVQKRLPLGERHG